MENYPLKPIDRDGNTIKKRNRVRFLEANAKLLRGLPLEDQIAINEQVGNVLVVEGFDDYGHVELVFIDKRGINHFIWVEPDVLRVQP